MTTYTAGQYESGWYVEKADPKNIDGLIQVAGPFDSASDAEVMCRVLDKADAKKREAAKAIPAISSWPAAEHK